MNAIKRVFTSMFATAVLAGCSTGSIGVKSDIQASAFEAGKTTRAQVIEAIGLPQRVEKDTAGNEHYFYEKKAHLTGMCLGCGVVSNNSGVIPAAAIESSKKKAKENAVEFVFNPDGTLINGF